jgi:hypothetical protein
MLVNDLAEIIPLQGTWKFTLGENSAWGDIQVPGCWEAQAYSKFIDGPASYQREIMIPKGWAGYTILVQFGAVSYICSVRMNGIELGSHQGMWTPFNVDLTPAVRYGEENLLELVVYKPGNKYPMRSSLAGFIPDIATTFGGIWQPAQVIALRAALDDLWVRADVDLRSIQVHCQAVKMGTPLLPAEWEIEVCQGSERVSIQRFPAAENGVLDQTLSISGAVLWDMEHPILYQVQVRLLEEGRLIACGSQRTGFRRLSAEGSQLLLNGKPCLLRGILSWGWEPGPIAPAYSPEQVREEIRRVRQLGFNLIKLCLFVPNEVYFNIADEEGMLLWQELPLWLPEVTEELRASAPVEYADLTFLIRKHPSVILYSQGCELSQSVDKDLLEKLNQALRGSVTDVLICDNSGSGESYGGMDFDYSDFSDYHPYSDLHYFEPLLDNWRRDWQPPRPWIFGEFCDSDTFRDLDEIIRANGGCRPWWLTEDNPVTTWRSESKSMLEAEQRLEKAQPGFTPQELVKISYAQSWVIRKYTLETLRRRAGMGGYIVTGLRDTPISTSGIWDDFSRPKWPAEEFRSINGEAILSLDRDRRRRWRFGGDRPDRLDLYNLSSGEVIRWHVILSHFGASLQNGKLSWTLTTRSGKQIDAGESELGRLVHPGLPGEVGVILCAMPSVRRAVELILKASLVSSTLRVENQWPVWVYPAFSQSPANLGLLDPAGVLDDLAEWLPGIKKLSLDDPLSPPGLVLSTVWDSRLWDYVQDGGKVFLLQNGDHPLPVRRVPFWREGIKLFPDHPIWRKFPQRGFTDMQFFGLASDIAFDSSRLFQSLAEGTRVQPVLRRLDAREFHVSEYMFEARMGSGVLLACSLRLQGGLGVQPAGFQRNVAGQAMLSACLNYLDRPVKEAKLQ